ncbi:MAG TPA: protein arginine kinase [Longimicrobiaceae bacterium]
MHEVTTPQGGLEWLNAEGPSSDVVLSTRVRLARNLQGFRFGLRAGEQDRRAVLQLTREAAESIDSFRDGSTVSIPSLDATQRQLLLERHLVSKELVEGSGGKPPSHAALMMSDREALSVMVNEEDHLRLQGLVSGFRLREAWTLVDRLDEELGGRVPYAFHTEFGYLTSCPTNVGTGLRASVLIHLPGLVLTQEIGKVLQGIAQVGLTFRGLYGEGSEVVGNFFQISNQTTLGKTEEDLIDHLQRIVQQVVQYEMHARTVLLRDAPTVIEDKVWRAYGLLRHARSISFEEVMNLLSGVRLGVGLKLLPGLSVYSLNRIMIFAQAAHLEQVAGGVLPAGEVDVYRAAYVRRILAQEGDPSPEGDEGELPR